MRSPAKGRVAGENSRNRKALWITINNLSLRQAGYRSTLFRRADKRTGQARGKTVPYVVSLFGNLGDMVSPTAQLLYLSFFSKYFQCLVDPFMVM